MKILVTGGAGYLGSHVVRKLMDRGHTVTVLDFLFFGKESLAELDGKPGFTLIQGDICDAATRASALQGMDAVIHLAAIVGDEAFEAQGVRSVEVNYDGTLALTADAKKAGVRRFLFASTASLYAGNRELESTENAKVIPVSSYAYDKLRAEEDLLAAFEADTFHPVVFRLSSLYGISPRMRFDLVVNRLTLDCYRYGKIQIFGGEQWRPFLHVEDAADAIALAMEAPEKDISCQIFNAGDRRGNYRISQLGGMYHDLFHRVQVETIGNVQDPRTYHIRFDKVEDVLGFTCTRGLRQGILDLMAALEAGRFSDAEDVRYYNNKVLFS